MKVGEAMFVEPDLSLLDGAPEFIASVIKGRIDEARRRDYDFGEFHWWRADETMCGCHGAEESPTPGYETWRSTGKDPIFAPHPATDAENHIQWKGTEVCMDVYCGQCEHHFHIDADFAYYVRCPRCRQVYRVGTQVRMIAVDEDDADMDPREDETGVWEG